MAINSLNETKTLHKVADFLGVTANGQKPGNTKNPGSTDSDKLDDADHKQDLTRMPSPPATGI